MNYWIHLLSLRRRTSLAVGVAHMDGDALTVSGDRVVALLLSRVNEQGSCDLVSHIKAAVLALFQSISDVA